ncbi:hypothetical protein ASD10_13205 [Aeromicrobium sp. Root472D3]|nr:hypothetical protein ASD10_13205 [Aeromicrobium sp. Root472D3]
MWSASSPIVDGSHVCRQSMHVPVWWSRRIRRPPLTPHSGQVLLGRQAGESHPVSTRARTHQPRTSDSMTWWV